MRLYRKIVWHVCQFCDLKRVHTKELYWPDIVHTELCGLAFGHFLVWISHYMLLTVTCYQWHTPLNLTRRNTNLKFIWQFLECNFTSVDHKMQSTGVNAIRIPWWTQFIRRRPWHTIENYSDASENKRPDI